MRQTRATTETLSWAEIDVGDELPELEILLTATVIVGGAIASRDYMPAHHDREFAIRQGAPDIFMNILTTNGLSIRFLTDWAGPEAMLKRLAIRLGVAAVPGDTLRFTGSVTKKDEHDGEGLVEVAFQGANRMGNHVSGSAVLGLLLDRAAG